MLQHIAGKRQKHRHAKKVDPPLGAALGCTINYFASTLKRGHISGERAPLELKRLPRREQLILLKQAWRVRKHWRVTNLRTVLSGAWPRA
ncbi:hypothetical protein EVAR_84638_1 [Eumeta japonica]|uniref:Uncharacterized protein n=1 Tax=Eumeta variegata TaxID=151549 RepID=A0A4C1UZT3_EUMVA|nr:hypothetical protein EVAR_84638_1 [Eumeta japonica]